MNHPAKTYPDGNNYEVLDLISFKCPSCQMVTWHARKSNHEILCPFCCHNLPGYVTKVSPERMVAAHETWLPHPRPEDQCGVSPFVLEFFMVQGIGFQCMAYRGGDGKWHQAFNDQELPGAVSLLE
jgi:hypothetical protein